MDSNLLLIVIGCLALLVLGLLTAIFAQIRKTTIEKEQNAELDRANALLNQELDGIKSQWQKAEAELNEVTGKLGVLQEDKHRLEKQILENEIVLKKEREAFQERLRLLKEAEDQLKTTFQSLSSEALKSNNAAFLELANTTFEKLKVTAKGDLELKEKAISELVGPIKDGLKHFDTRIQEMEKGRVAQMSAVSELVGNLTKANEQMRIETHNLVSALRAPNVRGQWGEMQLRRTIEISGMVKYCDFVEQKQIGEEGINLRPDVVIDLPNKRQVVIDSKVPLSAYIEAFETNDSETRELKLELHAKQLKEHLKRLGQKSYHEHLKQSPEFVVLFLPGEVFYSAALEKDPSLIEYGVDQKVLMATPTTLIALLKAIAYGWKNQEIAEQAGEISKAGRDLYESVVKMLEHMGNVRKHLNQTIHSFNQTIRSTDTRLLPRIRKFKDLSAGTEKNIPENKQIDATLVPVDVSESNPD